MDTPQTVLMAAHLHLGFEALAKIISLDTDYQLLGYAQDQQQLSEQLATMQPNLLLLCCGFFHDNGLSIPHLKRMSAKTRVVMLSARDRPLETVTAYYRAGAAAFICTCIEDEQTFKHALRKVQAGQPFFPGGFQQAMTQEMVASQRSQPKASLGMRETEVLSLIADGNSAKEIARLLNISWHTVEVHRRNIMNKLDIHKSTELTRYAIQSKLVTSGFEPDVLI